MLLLLMCLLVIYLWIKSKVADGIETETVLGTTIKSCTYCYYRTIMKYYSYEL